ncbi:WD40 repeat domain-containing protein [Thermogemmata fonticola]|uniref:WD40 repeat protein n=1 Tax=Thermogemmata fonticola TaxID=2755323 RepID=A0A7V9ACX7_9BACT|nr:PQQ-binding-like beta-propeller repeat protein [Thermogemmata fonticola]MBA2227227.1 hypothetical protein [Thermogemmata fonticola]
MYLLWYLSQQLVQQEIAHGDIQHGNLIILEGVGGGSGGVMGYDMRLVDYDGMWVPAVAGIPSGEYGHRHYQHPGREGYYGPAMDHFPLLVMYTGLYALAASGDRGGLWQRYDQGDNILFTEGDFVHPGGSGLLRELWGSGEEGLRRLVGHLVLGLRGGVDQVKPLGELVRYDGFEVKEVAGLEGWQEGEVVQVLGLEGGSGLGGGHLASGGVSAATSFPARDTTGTSMGTASLQQAAPTAGASSGTASLSSSNIATGLSPHTAAQLPATPTPAGALGGAANPSSGSPIAPIVPASARHKNRDYRYLVEKIVYIFIRVWYILPLLWSPTYTFIKKIINLPVGIWKSIPLCSILIWYNIKFLAMISGFISIFFILIFSILFLAINILRWFLGYGFGYFGLGVWGLPALICLLFLVWKNIKYWYSAFQVARLVQGQTTTVQWVSFHLRNYEGEGVWEVSASGSNKLWMWERARPYVIEAVSVALLIMIIAWLSLVAGGWWWTKSLIKSEMEQVTNQNTEKEEDHNLDTNDLKSATNKHSDLAQNDKQEGEPDLNMKEPELLCTLEGHKDWVRGVSVSGDGGVVVSGGDDGQVLVWDGKSGKLRHRLEGHKGEVWGVSVSGDGGVVVSVGRDGQVLVWDGKSGELRHRLAEHKGVVHGVSVSSDGKVVVSGGGDGQVLVWDGVRGQLRHRLEGHEGGVRRVSVSGDGGVVVSGGGDGQVLVWDGVSGQLRHRLEGHEGGVSGVSVSADGGVVVSGGEDKAVRVWKVPR